MTFYAGFDTGTFPGIAQIDWLKANTNLSWCGYYLAPAPSHSNTGWMNNRSYLAENGWGILPIYVGQQTTDPGSHIVTAAQGKIDGPDAATLAGNDGFAKGSYIFLDIEDGSDLTKDATSYIQAWAQGVLTGGYTPAFYCSHRIATQVAACVAAIVPKPRIWAFNVPTTDQHPYAGIVNDFEAADPAGSGFDGACIWQYEQNTVLSLSEAPSASMEVDLSTAITNDPGARS